MKVIIYEGVKHFRMNRKIPSEDSNIIKYIKQHSFYYEGLPIEEVATQIKQKLKKGNQETNEIKCKLQQLSLYLNNEKNKSIFQIYAIVLKNPNGITYKDIDSKVKIGIVSVSHYCCRLKKMNFVGLKHQKNEKVVYPKENLAEKKGEEQEQEKNVKRQACMPFHFHELSMLDNIWVNVSSYESYKSNGITNEDIKEKLNKTSQTKLIMKMVDQAKVIFDFQKQMVSQGKVFENRFKNVTKQIANLAVESVAEENQSQQKLNPKIEKWLKKRFPQYEDQKFLFNFINNELKDYFSVNGIRSARRTCTPIKLTRYIKILNNLNQNWPQTDIELKNFIIEEQKSIQNGIMHKRSILGILDGLVSKNILRKVERQRQFERQVMEDGEKVMQFSNKTQAYYFPMWDPDSKQKVKTQFDESMGTRQRNKKIHFASLRSEKEVENKMSLNQYRNELKIRFLQATLQQLYLSKLKKAFKRILYAKRAKTVIKTYEPETHIFYLLEQQMHARAPQIRADSYENLIAQIDQFIENQGIKQEPINNCSYDVIKIFRKNHKITETELRGKFGNSWLQKIQPMINCNLLESREEGIWSLTSNNRYFV